MESIWVAGVELKYESGSFFRGSRPPFHLAAHRGSDGTGWITINRYIDHLHMYRTEDVPFDDAVKGAEAYLREYFRKQQAWLDFAAAEPAENKPEPQPKDKPSVTAEECPRTITIAVPEGLTKEYAYQLARAALVTNRLPAHFTVDGREYTFRFAGVCQGVDVWECDSELFRLCKNDKGWYSGIYANRYRETRWHEGPRDALVHLLQLKNQ